MALGSRRFEGWPSIARLDPWRDVDRLIGDFFGRRRRRSEAEPVAWVPSAEIHQDDGALLVSFEIPGADKGSIELAATEDRLTIRGERKAPEGTCPTDGVCCTEFYYGPFERTVAWPLPVKAAESKATYRDGILEVRVPVAIEAQAPKATRIEVR
jgi:HSP20 family protein